MLSLSKILAPIDLSGRSASAVRFARQLAQRFHSELTLLHVLDSSIYELNASEMADPAIRRLRGVWQKQTESLLADFLTQELVNLDLHRIVLSGNPADQILQFANVEHTSLIVLPTYASEPCRQFVLGSVASRMLHSAHCPVLTGVHTLDAFPGELRGFRQILCAVDFSPQSLHALAWASQFGEQFQAQITIAHITPSSDDGVGAFFNPESRQNWAREIRDEDFDTRARQRIEQMRERVAADAKVFIDSSMDVPRAVCAAASQLSAGLVVIGRGPSTAIDRLRTKVYSIVRQSPVPVISV